MVTSKTRNFAFGFANGRNSKMVVKCCLGNFELSILTERVIRL